MTARAFMRTPGLAARGDRRRRLGVGLLVVGLGLTVWLPWGEFPPVALNVMCWGLLAVALDLLVGYTGLLSFGHAAFFGSSAYVAGLVAIHTSLPFPVAVLAGAGFAGVLAVPIGYLSVRRTGIYFAMVTLAFAQMVYYVANQWDSVTGGENGLQGIPRNFPGVNLSDPFYFYYAALPLLLIGAFVAWRTVHSPFGRVLAAIRDNPARARTLGYPVDRYKLGVFVISATLAGIAGSTFALGNSFATLDTVDWTTSGQVVIMLVLGGVGTLWGGLLGAAIIVLVENQLGLDGFTATDIVIGGILMVAVLLFRGGLVGTAGQLLRRTGWLDAGRSAGQDPGASEPAGTVDAAPVAVAPGAAKATTSSGR